MTEELAQYRQLELRLWLTRWRHEGQESAEEDAILDEMDVIWRRLSENEQALLNREGATCWPFEPTSVPPALGGVLFSSALASWAYEGFRSPAEGILSADAS